MRATIVIAWWEIVRYRFLLVAAAAASVLTLAARWLPSIGRYSVDEVTEVVAWFFVMLLVVLFCLGLGATFVGRDLSEDRLGFIFARPVSGVAIWTGKLLAIYLLVIASIFIVLLPACLTSPSLIEHLSEPSTPVVLLVCPLVLILLAHTLSVMVRARSAWIAADLAAIVVLTAFWWWSMQPLWQREAIDAASVCISAVGASVLVCMVGAGAMQLTVGRTDLHRSYRALSMSLWGLLAISTLAVAGYSSWLQRCEPEELERVLWVAPAPQGDWIAVAGRARGHFDYLPFFLFNVKTGSFTQLDCVNVRNPYFLFFSQDGTVAFVLLPEVDPDAEEYRIARFDLGTGTPRRRDSLVFNREKVGNWALSPDATRMAQLELTSRGDTKLLTISDLANQRLLFSAQLQQYRAADVTLLFLDNNHLRLYLMGESPEEQHSVIRIFEADISAGSLRQTGKVEPQLSGAGVFFSLDAAASLMLVRQVKRKESHQIAEVVVTAHDAVTGEIDTSFDTTHLQDADPTRHLIGGQVLAAVRAVSLARRSISASLRIIDGNGTLLQEIDLGGRRVSGLGPQPTRNTMELELVPGNSPGTDWRYCEVDLEAGRFDPINRELRPCWPREYELPRLWSAFAPVPDHFYYLQGEALLVYTPASGKLRPLLGSRKPGTPIPTRVISR